MQFILLFVTNIIPVFTLRNQMHVYNTVNIRKPETVRILISYIKNKQVEEDEMGGPCSTNGEEEERVRIIGRKARGKETTRKTQT
jgi:hypothetical protein